MKEKEKEVYVSPHIEVMDIEYEGILCASREVTAESDKWGGSWGDEF